MFDKISNIDDDDDTVVISIKLNQDVSARRTCVLCSVGARVYVTYYVPK